MENPKKLCVISHLDLSVHAKLLVCASPYVDFGGRLGDGLSAATGVPCIGVLTALTFPWHKQMALL
jgi:hypothetical protein